MANRTCSIDGCDKPHRARGYCSTHYNETFLPNRHRQTVMVVCAGCGARIASPATNNKSRRPVCSYRCRYRLVYGRWPESGRELVGPVPRRPVPRRVPTIRAPKSFERAIFVQGPCHWCGEGFLAISCSGPSAMRYCSSRCRKKGNDASRGGKVFQISPRTRLSIYERDGWVCQICGEPASREYDSADPWSPTLDHIVPRSKGGPDEPGNLRLAHAWCNSIRGDGARPEVAELFT